MHIGSGPGVVGLSAMQVKPLLPLRTVRNVPSGCGATTVASADTLAGAACIALAMSSASEGVALPAGGFPLSAYADGAVQRPSAAVIKVRARVVLDMADLPVMGWSLPGRRTAGRHVRR